MLLIGLRGLAPVFASVPLANTLVILGMLVLLAGIQEFFARKIRWGWITAIGAGAFTLFLYFTFATPDVGARIIVSSLCIAGIGAWMTRELVRTYEPHMGLPQILVTVVMVAYSVYMALRAAMTLFEKPVQGFMSAPPPHALAFLLGMVASIGVTFGFSAMVNRRLHLHLERLANYDLLTGVHNRRAFEEATQRELARCHHRAKPLSVLLLDLDHFKQVNDRYGHTAGDRVLKNAAATMKAVLRTEDTLGRIGGEEFCVLLPETEGEAALEIAERVRMAVSANPLERDGEQITVTVSIGVATAGESALTWEAVFQKVDRALYRAKQDGRDRVAV